MPGNEGTTADMLHYDMRTSIQLLSYNGNEMQVIRKGNCRPNHQSVYLKEEDVSPDMIRFLIYYRPASLCNQPRVERSITGILEHLTLVDELVPADVARHDQGSMF